MLYDFACKIKNVQNTDVLDDDMLNKIVNSVNASHGTSLEFRFVLPSTNSVPEFLVKAQTSISSMPVLHEKELEAAILSFTSYLEKIAEVTEGIVSLQDGFYNNSKTFKKLYI